MIPKYQVLRVHRWCGLCASLLIAVQAVTGVSNAFRYEAGQFFDPTGMMRQSPETDAAMNDVLRSLRHEDAGLAVERIVYPKDSGGVYFAHRMPSAGEMQYAAIDPGNAVLLRSGTLWTFPVEAAARIHYNLTIGLPGILIVAVIGLTGLVMLTTGILYWWPKKGKRAPSLAVRMRSPRKAQLRQLHRSSGIVMSIFLSYSLVTGTVLAINYSVSGLVSTSGPGTGLSSRATVDIDAALRLARAEFPQHDIRDIRFRNDTRADVFFQAPEHSPRAMHQVGVDLTTLTVAIVAKAEANDAAWVTWLPLHTGEFLGKTGTALVVTNALILFLLAVSGPLNWLSSKRRHDSQYIQQEGML